MKISIPYFPQERSRTCGVAALRMILAYYHQNFTEQELTKKLKLHSFGTFSTDLGALAIEHGFKVECQTFHLGLLGELELPYGTKITNELLKKIKVSPKDKMILSSWESYLSKGGELIWNTPQLSQLEDHLKNRNPVLISVNTAALLRFWKTSDNGHILVVTGYNASQMFVQDPDPSDHKAHEYPISKEVLFPAWVVNATRSSNYLLSITK